MLDERELKRRIVWLIDCQPSLAVLPLSVLRAMAQCEDFVRALAKEISR